MKTKKQARSPEVHWKPNLEQGRWCCITRLELLKSMKFCTIKAMVQFVGDRLEPHANYKDSPEPMIVTRLKLNMKEQNVPGGISHI
jgi:hypothetical protein